jgi:uncharacterized membrane protein HdeD (DUF308 family)
MESWGADPTSGVRVATALFGGVCLVLGLLLLFNIEAAVGTIVLLTGLSMVLTGIGHVVLADARGMWDWLAGGLLFAGGIAALAWPDATLWVLAVIVGLTFLCTGVLQVISAFSGSRATERTALSLMAGVATAFIGLLALAWPGATVLVLAALFGVRIMLVGILALMAAREMRTSHNVGMIR